MDNNQIDSGIRDRVVRVERVKYRDLLPAPDNWRLHPDDQRLAYRSIAQKIGHAGAPLVWVRPDGKYQLIDGHMRQETHPDLEVYVLITDLTEAEAAEVLATYDPIAGMAQTDRDAYTRVMASFTDENAQVQALLASVMGQETPLPPSTTESTSLADRFVVPPFSVLDARQGYWQDRKKAWLSLGIDSELGRESGSDTRGLTFARSAQGANIYNLRNRMRDATGRDPSWDEVIIEAKKLGYAISPGTSIFDPVVCELAYRWFCPPKGAILDPFAGGSVRGIVAAHLGYAYTGVDLQAKQIAANVEQAARITPKNPPRWIVGDSMGIDTLAAGSYDFVFSCPPYTYLEKYSDDAADLSTMDYPTFLAAYRAIIAKCAAMLKPDRFACFVVGDVRDKDGLYVNFVSDTIAAFLAAGMGYYNEAILVTQAASLAIRVSGQFSKSRKLGKSHQNVLVFVKGDPRKAVEACGEVEALTGDELIALGLLGEEGEPSSDLSL